MTRANAVARTASPDAGRQSARGREPPAGEAAAPLAQRVHALQRYAGNRSVAHGLWRAASGRCACGGKAGPDGECAACRQRRLGLQRSAAGAPRATAPPLVHRVLATPGLPLEPRLRADMETRLSAHPVPRATGLLAAGEISRPSDPPEREAERIATAAMDGPAPVTSGRRVDLRRVRIHTGRQAADSARAVGAHAYSVGPHVVFGDGRFGPGSRAGRSLLAHELIHVLQQGEGGPAQAPLMRQACAHDGKGSARCGYYWKFTEAPEENSGVDARIVRLGVPLHLGGTWVSEVSTPENALKRESKQNRGRVDGLKVIDDERSMRLEVVEIKSRSQTGGGCAQATREATEYVRMLRLIAPRIAAISRVAAGRGGIAPRDTPLAADRDALLAQGIDAKGADRPAWRFFSSLQAKLRRLFTRGFDTVEFARNTDGTPGTTYDVGGPTVTYDCTTRRGRRTTGTIQLQFQVNAQGGVSYNCIKNCPEDEDEKEKVKELHKPKEREKAKAERRREQRAVEEPEQERRPAVQQPVPEGPPILETLVTLAILHKAASAAVQASQRAALKAAAEKELARIAKRAPELARRLDSKALERFGTRAYERTLRDAAARYDKRLAKRVGKRALKGVGKVASKSAVRAVAGVLGVALLAADAAAMADHVSKGGEISIGLGPEAELKGRTKITKHGEPASPGVETEARLRDTIIDIDVSEMPPLSGSGEITATNVTIRSPGMLSDGTPLTVNFHVTLKNTTIVIKHKARLQGGRAVLERSEISDSTIEIDLPREATAPPPDRKPGEPIVVKGANLRITQRSEKVQAGPAGREAAPATQAEKRLEGLSAGTRKRIDANPGARRLLDAVLGTAPKTVRLDDADVNRFLEIVGTDLTPAQIDDLIANTKPLTGGKEEFFASLVSAVEAVRRKPAPDGRRSDGAGPPAQPKKPPKTKKRKGKEVDPWAQLVPDSAQVRWESETTGTLYTVRHDGYELWAAVTFEVLEDVPARKGRPARNRIRILTCDSLRDREGKVVEPGTRFVAKVLRWP
jgi:Domain of unknown function (DUF4157)